MQGKNTKHNEQAYKLKKERVVFLRKIERMYNDVMLVFQSLQKIKKKIVMKIIFIFVACRKIV
jgi:hypothetical protein